MVTELFAVVGTPVLHSGSPGMHNAAFRALGIDAVYVRLAAESAKDALKTAKAAGMRGMNVTSPFKEEFARLVRTKDGIAGRLGAVNTVVFSDGTAKGYNTDPYGVSEALKANGVRIKGRKAVVLGAGGAAKAAVLALLEEGADVTVANRTMDKAQAIAETFDCDYCSLQKSAVALREADILVSALSTAERVIALERLRKGMVVLDANYSAETSLVRDAKTAGCRVIDGRKWLLYQGAKAFGLFTGRKAPISVMRKALYARNGKLGAGNRKPETGNLALVGMMGSGKNATAKALGKRSGMGIIDTDAEIERKAGKRIKEMFAGEGEAAFRRMEGDEIRGIANARNKIVNCGGGAVLKTLNRKTLNRNALVVWLWARPTVMVARVAGDDSRPLLHVPDHEKEAILGRLLENRRRFYAETADLMIDTSGRTPEEIAERILYETDKALQG